MFRKVKSVMLRMTWEDENRTDSSGEDTLTFTIVDAIYIRNIKWLYKRLLIFYWIDKELYIDYLSLSYTFKLFRFNKVLSWKFSISINHNITGVSSIINEICNLKVPNMTMKITAFVLRVCYIEPKSYTSLRVTIWFVTKYI